MEPAYKNLKLSAIFIATVLTLVGLATGCGGSDTPQPAPGPASSNTASNVPCPTNFNGLPGYNQAQQCYVPGTNQPGSWINGACVATNNTNCGQCPNPIYNGGMMMCQCPTGTNCTQNGQYGQTYQYNSAYYYYYTPTVAYPSYFNSNYNYNPYRWTGTTWIYCTLSGCQTITR